MDLVVRPKALKGSIVAPPSKSYAHRLVIAAALSKGRTLVKNVGSSKDVLATLSAMKALGADCFAVGNDVEIIGGKVANTAEIYCGESGSTLRFLLPIAAALGVKASFTGESGLLKRPVNGLIAALNENGAEIDGLTVNGKLKSGRYIIDGSVSSQYITGLLFALPLLDGDSEIVIGNKTVSGRYLDITEDCLKKFGVEVQKTSEGYFVRGGQKYVSPECVEVEGDYSGAAFMLAAGALGGDVEITGLNPDSLQGDAEIVKILQSFGATIERTERGVRACGGKLKGISVDIDGVPDLAQITAVVAANAEGTTVLKNVSRLKIKESDRLRAIRLMLETAKVACFSENDDLYIIGDNKPIGGLFYGADDHRTAMSAAILALYAATPSTVSGIESCKKSYTSFTDDIIKLGGDVDVCI